MLHGTAKASLHQMNLTARCDTWRREGRMIDLWDMENAVDCEYKYHLGNYVLSQREWKRTRSVQGWWGNSVLQGQHREMKRSRWLLYSSPKWGFWKKTVKQTVQFCVKIQTLNIYSGCGSKKVVQKMTWGKSTGKDSYSWKHLGQRWWHQTVAFVTWARQQNDILQSSPIASDAARVHSSYVAGYTH